MTDKIRRTIVFFIVYFILVSAYMFALPSAAYGWTDKITDPSAADGHNYTDIPALAEKLDSIFGGSVGLYSGSSCEEQNGVCAPLGCTDLNRGHCYYVWSEDSGYSISGYQCFIYANAVYNHLFADVPDNRNCACPDSVVAVSNTVVTSGDQLRALFTDAAVRTGAYVRTTVNSDGSYSGDGHSMIVLSYDDEYIDILDGNSDGNGLVCVKKYTWDELQTAHFGRRRLGKIVQPTESCYESLYPAPAAEIASASDIIESFQDTEGENGLDIYPFIGTLYDPDIALPLPGLAVGEPSSEFYLRVSENAIRPAEDRIHTLELFTEPPAVRTSDSDIFS